MKFRMQKNITKRGINKILTLNLATTGILLLTVMALLLTVSFSLDIESNLPLWTALLLMAAGVTAIIMQLKKTGQK